MGRRSLFMQWMEAQVPLAYDGANMEGLYDR